MNINDFSENSESSDEDYVPDTSNADLPSEEDSDGNVEDILPDSEDVSGKRNRKGNKRTKPRKKVKSKSPSPEKKITDTQSTDDLWADFKKDTGFKTRAERQTNTRTTSDNNKPHTQVSKHNLKETIIKTTPSESSKTQKITEVYKFAGEEVIVEKEISTPSASKLPTKRGAKGGGINSILSNLGKKTKISTLEKSKLDWDKFKKEENIEDELHAYSKSKDGYLEKQDFLQRADIRQFEIEKDIRSSLRANRGNNI